jgi:hypothetical protein
MTSTAITVWRGEPARVAHAAMLCAAAICCTAITNSAHADQGDIVVLREVAPRVAYRGLPRAELPEHTVIDTFPNQQFAQATDLELGRAQAGPLRGTQAQLVSGHPAAAFAQPTSVLNDSLRGGTRRDGGGIADRVQQATGSIAGSVGQALAPLSGVGR